MPVGFRFLESCNPCWRGVFFWTRAKLLVVLFVVVIAFTVYSNVFLITPKWRLNLRKGTFRSEAKPLAEAILQGIPRTFLSTGAQDSITEDVNSRNNSKGTVNNERSIPSTNSKHNLPTKKTSRVVPSKKRILLNKTREPVLGHRNTKGSLNTRPPGRNTPKESVFNNGKRGLISHLWFHICASSIDVLCRYPLFPKGPDVVSVVDRLNLKLNIDDYGRRMFGYIIAPRSGPYTFVVSSDDASEVWLSKNGDPKNAEKICNAGERNESYAWTEIGDFEKYRTQKSKQIDLVKDNAYFIDIIHVQGGGSDGFQLAWKLPGGDTFEVIDSNNTRQPESSPRGESDLLNGNVIESVLCSRSQHHHLHDHRPGISSDENTPRYIAHDEVKDALSYCPYKPSYIAKGPLPEGYYYAISIYLNPLYQYPSPDYHGVRNYDQFEFYRNRPLDPKKATEVATDYMGKLHSVYPGKFKLLNIISIEKKVDKVKGSRFLVELNVTVRGDPKPAVLSEYIYKNISNHALCYPTDFQWHRQAKVALIITLRNQGRWMAHFLDNLEDIYVNTRDKHVSLVVFDYESDDIDLEKELKSRRLPPYKVAKKAGNYSRTESFNAAVRLIDDPHTIVFTMDLHLELPNSLFDNIRKHCFEGKSAYTPIIIRLRCGHSPVDPGGLWEAQGFGLIGMYKSDWDRIGGLNEKKFKQKWGGEDWEMLDRVVGGKLEYERLRADGIMHYQHSRKGMWTGDEALRTMSD